MDIVKKICGNMSDIANVICKRRRYWANGLGNLNAVVPEHFRV